MSTSNFLRKKIFYLHLPKKDRGWAGAAWTAWTGWWTGAAWATWWGAATAAGAWWAAWWPPAAWWAPWSPWWAPWWWPAPSPATMPTKAATTKNFNIIFEKFVLKGGFLRYYNNGPTTITITKCQSVNVRVCAYKCLCVYVHGDS